MKFTKEAETKQTDLFEYIKGPLKGVVFVRGEISLDIFKEMHGDFEEVDPVYNADGSFNEEMFLDWAESWEAIKYSSEEPRKDV